MHIFQVFIAIFVHIQKAYKEKDDPDMHHSFKKRIADNAACYSWICKGAA